MLIHDNACMVVNCYFPFDFPLVYTLLLLYICSPDQRLVPVASVGVVEGASVVVADCVGVVVEGSGTGLGVLAETAGSMVAGLAGSEGAGLVVAVRVGTDVGGGGLGVHGVVGALDFALVNLGGVAGGLAD